MVGMVRVLIRADCTEAWLMHLHAVSNCLTVFAAAGHFNYLRSAHYYLQQMNNLEEKYPDVHRKFFGGLFPGAISAGRGLVVISLSNKF